MCYQHHHSFSILVNSMSSSSSSVGSASSHVFTLLFALLLLADLTASRPPTGSDVVVPEMTPYDDVNDDEAEVYAVFETVDTLTGITNCAHEMFLFSIYPNCFRVIHNIRSFSCQLTGIGRAQSIPQRKIKMILKIYVDFWSSYFA